MEIAVQQARYGTAVVDQITATTGNWQIRSAITRVGRIMHAARVIAEKDQFDRPV